jgi:ABC-2 type transport system permease protein
MHALLLQIRLSVRLNFRNRMALLYGYLFPAVFLLAFRTLYRHERVPLLLHAGELLTVTILGGACFGLPTGIVSDRERGVWRRYKALPVSPLGILGGTLVTRYLLLLTAGLLQLGLAMLSGMPPPQRPFALWAAFSAAAIAFMGIGLGMAMLASNVPAVQALGQCIFLPMLIVGGVAVPLASLPEWAQHVSAFLPGRYSVAAIQAAVSGAAVPRFDFAALLIVGLTGAAAGVLAFRWDRRQRPSPWVAGVVLGWLIVGIAAESRGGVGVETAPRVEQPKATEFLPPSPPADVTEAPAPPVARRAAGVTWQEVTAADIDGVAFERLPDDAGIIAPIAAADQQPDPEIAVQLEQLRALLPEWTPGHVSDPVQRARNYLAAAAVLDVYRLDPLERFVPLVVFERIESSIQPEDLPKVLYFVAVHPNEGSVAAARQLHELGLPDAPADARLLRNRIMLYAFKMLGRIARK